MQWNQTYKANKGSVETSEARCVIQTGDGGYALAGLDGFLGTSNLNFWLVKTDSSGNMQWNQTYGGSGDDGVKSVIQNIDGSYVFAGATDSTGAGNSDFWLVRTTGSLNNIQISSTVQPTTSLTSVAPTGTMFPVPSEQPGSSLLWYYIIAAIVGVGTVSVAILTLYFKQMIIVKSKKRTEYYTNKINEIENKLKLGIKKEDKSSQELRNLRAEILKDRVILKDDCDRLVKIVEEILNDIDAKA
jgi:hypothetical protein